MKSKKIDPTHKIRHFFCSGWTWGTNDYGIRLGTKIYKRTLLDWNNKHNTEPWKRKTLAEILQIPEKDLKIGNLEISVKITKFK